MNPGPPGALEFRNRGRSNFFTSVHSAGRRDTGFKLRKGQQDIYVPSPFNDRISELPKPLLLHILSFLPTKDCIRTSLLAKCWSSSSEDFLKFVDHVFMLRDGSDLEEFRLQYCGFTDNVDDSIMSRLNLSSRRTLQVTRLGRGRMGLRIPSALGQLRTLELVSVNLPAESFSLDSFSNCPALETLKFKSCCFKNWPSLCISAPSLKIIVFNDCLIKIEILEISGFKEIDFLHGKDCCSQIKRPKKLTPLFHLKKLVVTYHVRDRKEIEWVKLLESNAPYLDGVTFNWEDEEEEDE
ncbi:hypothetical protein H6P81_010805 [Aristolochia fimbriata]|uniref:F-box domain-containing protein n=1 Tax=Aristolochia fimbriata TaxID=158543 RepID=A0AAV7EPT6_ARIFI|nr:hypothetical protein H6P81_010805 [Aristolochia fimbriata]